MGSIKASMEYQRLISQMLEKLSGAPSEINGACIQADVNALSDALTILKMKMENMAVGEYEFYQHLEGVIKFLQLILDELLNKGNTLIIDKRYVEINQKQQRPARKLNIPDGGAR